MSWECWGAGSSQLGAAPEWHQDQLYLPQPNRGGSAGEAQECALADTPWACNAAWGADNSTQESLRTFIEGGQWNWNSNKREATRANGVGRVASSAAQSGACLLFPGNLAIPHLKKFGPFSKETPQNPSVIFVFGTESYRECPEEVFCVRLTQEESCIDCHGISRSPDISAKLVPSHLRIINILVVW